MTNDSAGADRPADVDASTAPELPDGKTAKLVRILIAEDHDDSRALVAKCLSRWGYEAVAVKDGVEALAALSAEGAPTLAILDWTMPGLNGIDVCRRIREQNRALYIILLTARDSKANMIEGLTSGADDYLVKPFDHAELNARITVGLRIVSLQSALADRVAELHRSTLEMQRTLAEKEQLLGALELSNQEIATLRRGLVTICAWTKRVQHEGQWISIDEFLSKHLRLNLTHGISEEAAAKVRAELAAARNARQGLH